jgi:3-mercaptopyruvate sulfurtransferase SseA
LEEYDFKDIHILVGGINAWRDAGLPLEPKKSEVRSQESEEKLASYSDS